MTKGLVPSYTLEGLARRLAEQERHIKDLRRQVAEVRNPRPLEPGVFHWPTQVETNAGSRAGPHVFPVPGLLHRIQYEWDTAPAADATVEWYLDGTLTFTHTVTGGTTSHTETESQSYSGESIIAIVTSVDSTARGLTAYVFLR